MGQIATPMTGCFLWVRHLAAHLKDLISSQLHNTLGQLTSSLISR